MIDTNLNGLDQLIIPQHRAERPEWHTEKGWEKIRHKSMKDNIGSKDVVYYVGAEEGEFPALCAKWGASVYMFEPNPKVWPNIKAIWQANKLPLAFCFTGFASNETTAELWNQNTKDNWPRYADNEVIGNHGFKELYQEADNYPQYRLDDVYSYYGSKPTVLTMDVEGSEFEVLKGAEKTIIECKPKIWLSLHPEFLFDQWNVYGREVRDWIIDRGYNEQLLDYQHEVHFLYTAN